MRRVLARLLVLVASALGTGVVVQTSILHGRFYFAKILSVRLFETVVSCFCPSLTTPHVYLPSALAGGVSLRLS